MSVIIRMSITIFRLVKAGTTRLGTDPVRFFEFGTAPALEALPYATWQELSGEPVNYLAGAPDSDIGEGFRPDAALPAARRL